MAVSLERACKILGIKEFENMEKTSGIIESREVKDVGEDQLITLTIKGKKFTAFSNAITEDVANRLSDVKQGDEVDVEFTETQKTNRFGKPVTYRNIADLIKVQRGEGVGAASAPQSNRTDGDKKHRAFALSYSKDCACKLIEKIGVNEDGDINETHLALIKTIMFQWAEEMVVFLDGPISDENGG